MTYTAGADGAAGTYTATVTAQGKKAGWTGAASTTAKVKIGGVEVDPSTTGWTITGTADSGKVEVKAGLPAGN